MPESTARTVRPVGSTMASGSAAAAGPTGLAASAGTAGTRHWANWAVSMIDADRHRSADTHLLVYPLPAAWGIDLYLKDESTHPTGSLKHRLARSLFLYGLCNGWITEGMTIVEASSGSTAVSEAYFARMLGLPFVAVMPRSTSPEKVAEIEFEGGRCHLVDDPTTVYAESARLAAETGGHYLDQFTYAERATDWRGNNNIAESIFEQMARERHPVPDWVVVGAGTGGTSATIGRYVRYRQHDTGVCVVDPEGSVFYDAWCTGDLTLTSHGSVCIEGIGRPRVEPSFVPSLIDRMMRVPDVCSVAAARHLRRKTGWWAGGSTGTNLWGAFGLVAEMLAAGRSGSIVTLLCDGGARYQHTCYSDDWVAARGWDLAGPLALINDFLTTGRFAG